MSTITFFNNKGGVGKTTLTINIAYALAEMGKRVLVVDFDTQKNSWNFFNDIENAAKMGSVNPTRYEKISIILGEIFIYDEDTKNYDVVIYDLPPALNDETKLLLSECNFVFVPIELGTFSIEGIAKVTDVLAESKTSFAGCIITKFDKKNPSDLAMQEILKSNLGDKVLENVIPLSNVIKNSVNYRKTAFEYMHWTHSVLALGELTAQVADKLEEDFY